MRRIDAPVRLDVLHRQQRTAGRYPSHQWQSWFVGQTDAPRAPGFQRDRALACQRLQVALGSIERAETKVLGDLGAGGRSAALTDAIANELENLLLTGGQHGWHGHVWP